MRNWQEAGRGKAEADKLFHDQRGIVRVVVSKSTLPPMFSSTDR